MCSSTLEGHYIMIFHITYVSSFHFQKVYIFGNIKTGRSFRLYWRQNFVKNHKIRIALISSTRNLHPKYWPVGDVTKIIDGPGTSVEVPIYRF